MLTPFKKTEITVFRKTPPPSNWGDPTWVEQPTKILASIYPITVKAGIEASQYKKPVKEMIIIHDLAVDLKEDDEIVYDKNISRSIIGIKPQRSGFINHLEVYTTDTQWVR